MGLVGMKAAERAGLDVGTVPSATAQDTDALRSLQAEIDGLRQAEARARTRSDLMTQLQEVGAELGSAFTAAEVVARFVDLSRRVAGASAAVVYLEDGEGRFRLQGLQGMASLPDELTTLSLDAPLPLARALRTRVPVWLDSHQALLNAYPAVGQARTPAAQLQAVAALPIVQGPQLLGGFALSFASPRAFDEDERDWLVRMATQLGLALQRARSFAAEQDARAEAETLLRVAASLSEHRMDLEAIVQQVTDEATSAVGAQFGAFFYNVTNAEGESYFLYTLSGAPREAFERFGLPRNTPLFAPTFSGEGIVRLADVKKDPRYGKVGPHHGMPKGHLPVTSYLAVPVVSRNGAVIGGLFFGHPEPGRFTEPHERLVAGLAANAAVAIDNARLFRATCEAEEAQRTLVEELTQTVRLNELMAGVLAHDLRNPLSGILAAAQLARARSDSEVLKRPLERIVASGERMGRMVEQLLDLTRIRVGRGLPVEPAACDLGDLVRHAVEELEQAGGSGLIQLEARGDLQGSWDADRVMQMFSNLIGNAIQHRADGPVQVTLAGRDTEVEARIHNQGQIPGELLPRLFEPMPATERRGERTRGLGLGLFISQQIARAHGGAIEVESTCEAGTSFVVKLPRQARPVAVSDSAGQSAAVQEAKERAWQTEQRMRLLVDSVRDCAIYMLDAEGRVSSWNEGAQRLKGYRAPEVMGTHFSRFFVPDDITARVPEAELRRARESGTFETEGWRVRKDGSRFWANVMIGTIRDRPGRLLGYYKVTRDLTERRMAEQSLRDSENRLRLIVEGVKDYAIYMLDADGRVATWNGGAELIKGYTREEIVGQPFTLFFPPEARDQGRPAALLAEAAREGRAAEDAWRVRKDGTRFWASVVITALRDPTSGQVVGFAKVVRDLTERRRLDEERLRRAQAEEAVRLRDEFLSLVSHELRTPLAGMQLQLEALQQQLGGSDARVAQKLRRASFSGDRLADLIETLLDVSRIATGRFSLALAQLDLGQVVRDVVEGMRLAADKAGCQLSLEVAGPQPGIWDRVRVEQLVTNLLSNAIKYGAGRPIEVSVAREAGDVLLEVRDHGPGIAPADLPRLFTRFERAASIRHYGGLGLGLYLVREIARAHGGSAGADNAPDGGARFWVRLPAEQEGP